MNNMSEVPNLVLTFTFCGRCATGEYTTISRGPRFPINFLGRREKHLSRDPLKFLTIKIAADERVFEVAP